MIIPFLVFWILLIWSFHDGDLNFTEAAVYVVVWLVLLTCFLLIPQGLLWFVVPTVLLDVMLIFKIFGQDIQIN